MLTYALMLGLSGQVGEAHAWLQRARARIGDEPEAPAEDLATLDTLRLLTFTVTAEAGDGSTPAAGRSRRSRRVLDFGVGGARARMNLVRGYLLVDQPDQADSVLAGHPGDEIAAAAARARARRAGSRCGEADSQKPDVGEGCPAGSSRVRPRHPRGRA